MNAAAVRSALVQENLTTDGDVVVERAVFRPPHAEAAGLSGSAVVEDDVVVDLEIADASFPRNVRAPDVPAEDDVVAEDRAEVIEGLDGRMNLAVFDQRVVLIRLDAHRPSRAGIHQDATDRAAYDPGARARDGRDVRPPAAHCRVARTRRRA